MATVDGTASTSSRIRTRTLTDPFLFTNLNVIRLTLDHAKSVEKLVDPKMTFEFFGNVNIEKVLLNSLLSMGVTDEDGKIVGVLVLNTYPNISALPPWEWDHWLKKKYGITDATSRNTLFIHLILFAPEYSKIFFRYLVDHMFKIRNFLKYAIMVVPPGKHDLSFMADLGVAVYPRVIMKVRGQYLYMLCRKDFQTQYKIRRAVEEDNDDLVPLIETHSKRLTELYGNYYIAEILIGGKEIGRHIIVAEYQSTAVAVLILNSNVNYKVLNDDFELVPYNGLKKQHPDDLAELSSEYITKHSTERIRRSRQSDDEILDIIERHSEKSESLLEDEEEIFMRVSLTESDEFSLVFTSASLFIFQDDEDTISTHSVLDTKSYTSSESLLGQYLEMQEKETATDDTIDWLSGYSSSKGTVQRIPDYKGEDNAFSLEVAACLPDHEYGVIMLFEAAFECFPDRDYCVMAVPSTTNVIKLSKYFGRVMPRCNGSFPSELYVMHKNSILGELSVEPASKFYEKPVKHLLSTIPNGLLAIQQFESSIYYPRSLYSSFVFLCEKEVIGIARCIKAVC